LFKFSVVRMLVVIAVDGNPPSPAGKAPPFVAVMLTRVALAGNPETNKSTAADPVPDSVSKFVNEMFPEKPGGTVIRLTFDLKRVLFCA